MPDKMRNVFVSHLEWTGAAKGPTDHPDTFSRDLNVWVDAVTLRMSSAPDYHGDPSKANPEQLFVASISACQALTYLFVAATHGIRVVGYTDDAEGWLAAANGKIHMTKVMLRPHIAVATTADASRALELVGKAHSSCFIANSVSTPIAIEPTVIVVDASVPVS
jgi:organic hydroperoxide reductase OsmC/OhrA